MNAIPEALRETSQWVRWKFLKSDKGKPRKVPTGLGGRAVDVKDRSKWSEYKAVQKFKRKGFVTTREDNFIGIDLDGCADPKTGEIAPWAREVIGHLGSYTEWSPSKTGVRIFGTTKRPWEDNHQVPVVGPQMVPDRNPGIEVYDHSRYFTVTGEPIGEKSELADITDKLDELSGMFGMVDLPYQFDDSEFTEADEETVKRATAYLKKMDGGISGSNGHKTTLRAAVAMVHGFCLPRDDAFYLLQEHHNPKCEPPWSDKELRHKVASVNPERAKQPRGYLLGKSKEKENLSLDQLLEARGIEHATTYGELRSKEIVQDWLVESVIAEGAPAVFAGASKSMKTSIAIDLCLSLTSGSPFLGHFKVPKKHRVLMFSAESGEASIQETANRVVRAKGLDLEVFGDEWRIHSSFIPKSDSSEDRLILKKMIRFYRVTVVILDPTYFILDGENQASIYKQGGELRELSEEIKRAGATPVFIDHVKLSSGNVKEHKPLELGDLSGAGKSPFFRQWFLISRREKFDPNEPVHRLWATHGGNHGWCGQHSITIDETRDPLEGRAWDLTVQDKTATEIAEKETLAEQKRLKQIATVAAVADSIKDFLSDHVPRSARQIREALGISGAKLNLALTPLVQQGVVEEREKAVRGNNGQFYDGFALV